MENTINLLAFLAPHLWQNVTLAVKTGAGLIRNSVRYNEVKRTTEVVCGYKRQS